ncbi:hypothetical protein D9M69_309180 [compost metagenome]
MGQESAEADAGVREGFSTSFARRSRWLERELKELHRASERLKLASALFDFAELNRWILDRYRDTFGLENPLTNDCYWPLSASRHYGVRWSGRMQTLDQLECN